MPTLARKLLRISQFILALIALPFIFVIYALADALAQCFGFVFDALRGLYGN